MELYGLKTTLFRRLLLTTQQLLKGNINDRRLLSAGSTSPMWQSSKSQNNSMRLLGVLQSVGNRGPETGRAFCEPRQSSVPCGRGPTLGEDVWLHDLRHSFAFCALAVGQLVNIPIIVSLSTVLEQDCSLRYIGVLRWSDRGDDQATGTAQRVQSA